MALPTQLSGATYVQQLYQLRTALQRENGVLGGVPAMSYGQLVAATQAWRHAAARSSDPQWDWLELLQRGLGYEQKGDRFVMQRAHAKAPAHAELLRDWWESVEDLAATLDEDKTVVRSTPLDWSWSGYERAARDAWQVMQAAEPEQPSPLPAPVEAERKPPASTTSRWPWLLLVVAVALYAERKRRN